MPRPIEKKRVSRFHTPVDDRGLRVTGGVQVGQVVDDVFARCRGVCFRVPVLMVRSSPKKCKQIRLQRHDKPEKNNANQWTSGYTKVERSPTILRLTRSSELANKKKRVRRSRTLGYRVQAQGEQQIGKNTGCAPTPPTTHRAPL